MSKETDSGTEQRFISVLAVHQQGEEYCLTITIAGASGHTTMTPYPNLPYNELQTVIERLSPDEMLKIGHLIVEQAVLAKYTTISGG